MWNYAMVMGSAFIAILILRSAFVEAYKIPSESMIPTLLVGDDLLANKFVYGISRSSSTVGLPMSRMFNTLTISWKIQGTILGPMLSRKTSCLSWETTGTRVMTAGFMVLLT